MSQFEAVEVNRLQLQSSAPETPGDLGFKLIGEDKKQPEKIVRIWVRRKQHGARNVWHRYIAPVPTSNQWEVRLHMRKPTGAMTLVPFEGADQLKALAKSYAFPKAPATLDALKAVESDDALFNLVRDWAVKTVS